MPKTKSRVAHFSSNRILFPLNSMLNIVYGRALLIKGEYSKLIGCSEYFSGIASVFPNLLGHIYTDIYLAADKGFFQGVTIEGICISWGSTTNFTI